MSLITKAVALLKSKKGAEPTSINKLDAIGKIVEEMREEEVEAEVLRLKELMAKPIIMRLINVECNESTEQYDLEIAAIVKEIKRLKR